MARIGSVKFYKQLILSVLAACFVLPVSCSLALYVENGRLRKTLVAQSGEGREGSGAQALLTLSGSSRSSLPSAAGLDMTPSRGKPRNGASIAMQKQPAYLSLHPEFRSGASVSTYAQPEPKTVYLTFDDGPSSRTDEILDVLEEHGVKATFFVLGKNAQKYPGTMARIAADGHTVGMHGFSHKYNQIYDSPASFIDDMYLSWLEIEKQTGVRPEILRFPGGSVNRANISNYQPLIAEVLRRGFMYHDWNVDAGDLEKDAAPADLVVNTLKGVRKVGDGTPVVLMHDAGGLPTVQALGPVLESLKAQGYSFGTLDGTVGPIMFVYPDSMAEVE